uniref:Putative pre-16S rRNA nuclease n=1 Tax=Chlorobium chlorochromatii (strain CaD3) TaxID=340177 RepID=YQGF_CHLCH|nr:RecName: Full=Putative pre-16S rRNA nuclease [Chlorobium chlorochromatii CaD3]
MPLYQRIVAIDYGTKRIGVAKSDPLGMFAQPIGTVDRAGLSKLLSPMVEAGEVQLVVVGYPLNRHGEQTAMTEVIDRFIESLRLEFPALPIETINEHCSSKSAMQLLVASGTSRKERKTKGRLDTAAACLLLSDYLEQQK